ncbi:MAG TPA: hypothetical protein VFX28_20890, partial [Methylomirabilota bacterium]|nr:hypothetical protein [Methylomirabilota bacterium]
TDLLVGRGVVVRWTGEGGVQLRIALARKAGSADCTFLEGTRCGIHAFKPLLCRAGPAGWPWISNPSFFWFYVRRSPSFRHEPGRLDPAEANGWFAATRRAEAVAAAATSLAALAAACEVPEALVRRLPVVEFDEVNIDDAEDAMSGIPKPMPVKPLTPVPPPRTGERG